MSGNSIGTLFRVTTFGESHGPAMGVIVDGVAPGMDLADEDIQFHLNRRRPGQSAVTTPRGEPDTVEILSGIFEGRTTGAPLAMMIRNRDHRPSAYDDIRDVYRPGHADFTYEAKYGIRDHRGGGRSSGRETSARVAAGAVALKLLGRRGVKIVAYTLAAGGIRCKTIDYDQIEKNPMRAPDAEAAEKMVARVVEVSENGNSVGGIIECRVTGLPAGLGDPAFDKLDAMLARGIMSLGAVKAIEFGLGFAVAEMTGSEHNDQMNGDGFMTNNAGGVLGGISTGQELIFRIAVKPTASISSPQQTVGLDGKIRTIAIDGRHDPCICARIVPVVECMTAIVLEDAFKRQAAVSE